MTNRVPAGLCDACVWRQDIIGARSTFVMCRRGLTDTTFMRYPRLPVLDCRGFEPPADSERQGSGALPPQRPE